MIRIKRSFRRDGLRRRFKRDFKSPIQFLSATRITEADDTRITEADDTRITQKQFKE